MLYDESDTDKVKVWLLDALKAGARSGKTAAGLAAHCGTTPQAVNGWKRTGRITKSNLAKAAQYLGHGPSFLGPRLVAHDDPARSNPWPFERVAQADWNNLTERQKGVVEQAMLDALALLKTPSEKRPSAR